jgi:hypothetical protein
MARGLLTIHDVPQEVRTRGANRARNQLRELIANPHLTPEQRADLQARILYVSQWESGAVALPQKREDPPPSITELAEAQVPPRNPQHHSIEVSESIQVDEK